MYWVLVHIVSTATHVSVSIHHQGIRNSIASADEVEPGVWWVCRVRVADAYQGQGVGSRLVAAMLTECTKHGARLVKVTPGGYGADPRRQKAFYARCGFVGDDLMAWTPPTKT